MRKPKKTVKKRVQKTVQNSEQCLHMHCQAWLEKSGIWNGLLIFHVPNERKGGIGAIMHFKRLGVRTGVADYLAFTCHRRVAIELKDDKGNLSAEQKEFRHKWEVCGGDYFVVRTIEDFQKIVSALAIF